MFPLHKAPAGLLELFRLRTTGAQPPQFGGMVTPTTDITEFYAADLKALLSQAPTAGAIAGGGISNLLVTTVPFRLHIPQALFVCGAAAATNVTVTIQLLNPFQSVILAESRFFAGINAGAAVGVSMPLSPIVLPAGWVFQANVAGTAAGVDHTIQASALIDNFALL